MYLQYNKLVYSLSLSIILYMKKKQKKEDS